MGAPCCVLRIPPASGPRPAGWVRVARPQQGPPWTAPSSVGLSPASPRLSCTLLLPTRQGDNRITPEGTGWLLAMRPQAQPPGIGRGFSPESSSGFLFLLHPFPPPPVLQLPSCDSLRHRPIPGVWGAARCGNCFQDPKSLQAWAPIFGAGVHISMWEVGGNVHTLHSGAAPVHGGPALCWLECGGGVGTLLG